MALFHVHAGVIRRSVGESVVAAAAYRAGERILESRTGDIHDYRLRRGVDDAVILAPAGAPPWVLDRAELWNRADHAETRWDAQLARSFDYALPVELDGATNKALALEYVRKHFVNRGMVVDVAFHDLNGPNPHFHPLATLRALAGEGFAACKNREWNRKEWLKELREGYATTVNEYLTRANVGQENWIDHRSLAARLKEALTQCDYPKAVELCRLPARHMGKAATVIAARGERSTRAEYLRQEAEAATWRVTAMLGAVAEWKEEEKEGLERRLHDAWQGVAEEMAIQRRVRAQAVDSRPEGRDLLQEKLAELNPHSRAAEAPRVADLYSALAHAENELSRIDARRRADENRRLAKEGRRRATRRADVESKTGGREFYEEELDRLDRGWRDRGNPRTECEDAALTHAEEKLAEIEAARRAEESRERDERSRRIQESEAWKLVEEKLDEIAPGWRRTGTAPITEIDAALTYAEIEQERQAELRRQAVRQRRELEAANRQERVNRLLATPGGDVSLFVALDRQSVGWREAGGRLEDADGALETAEQNVDDRGSAIEHQLLLDGNRAFPDASSAEWRQSGEAFDGGTDAVELARALTSRAGDRARVREIVKGESRAGAPARQSVVGRMAGWLREGVEWLVRTLGLVEPTADAVVAGLPRVATFFGEPTVPAVENEPWRPGERVGALGKDAWTAVTTRLIRTETASGSEGYRPRDLQRALERYLEPLVDGELRRQKVAWEGSSGAPRPTRESAREAVLEAHRSKIEELLLIESYALSGEPAEAAGLEQHRDRVGRAATAVMKKLQTEVLYFGEPSVPAVGDEPWNPGEGTGRVARDTWTAVRERLDRGETAGGNVGCRPKDRQRAQELHLKPLIDGELRRQERQWRSARAESPPPTRESAGAVVLERYWLRIEELVQVECYRVSGEPERAAGVESHRAQVDRRAGTVMASLPIREPWPGKPEIPAVTDESWEPTETTPLESVVYHEVNDRLDRGESATGRAMGYTHDDREQAERLYLDALTAEVLERQRQAWLASERSSPPQPWEDIRAAVRREHRTRLRSILATACRSGREGGDLGDRPGGATAQPGNDERSAAPASSPPNIAGDPRPPGDASRGTSEARPDDLVGKKAPATRVESSSTSSVTGPPSPDSKEGPAEADEKERGDGGWQR